CDHCTYVIYLDSDLWFPSHFWVNYSFALERQEQGYWSCYVKNIEQSISEELIINYTQVDSKITHIKWNGSYRYDEYQGRIGHFQCMPYGMHLYTLSSDESKRGIEGCDLAFSKQAIINSQDKKQERRIGAVPAYHLDHESSWTGAPREL